MPVTRHKRIRRQLLHWPMALDVRRKRRKRFSTTAIGGAETDRVIRFIKLDADRILVDGAPVPLAQVAQTLRAAKSQTALISLSPHATSQQLIDLLTVLAPVEQLHTQVLG